MQNSTIAPEMMNRFVARSADAEPVFDGILFTGRVPHRRLFICLVEAIGLLDLKQVGRASQGFTVELPHYAGYDMLVPADGRQVEWVTLLGHHAPAVPVVKITGRLPEEMRTRKVSLILKRNRAGKVEVIDGWCGSLAIPFPVEERASGYSKRVAFWRTHAIALTEQEVENQVIATANAPVWAQ